MRRVSFSQKPVKSGWLRMNNAPFRQADLVRALKAAKAAEIPVGAYEITLDGTIRVYTESAVEPPKPGRTGSWDDL